MYLRPILHSLRRVPVTCPTQTACLARVCLPSSTQLSSSATLVRLASTQSSGSSGTADLPEEIYYGTLTPKIRAVKVFSLTTSAVGLAVQPMLIEQGTKLGGMPMVVFMCGFAGLFTFVTPLLLHFITKKYVTRISYNAGKDEYTATTISFILLKKEVTFK